MTNRNQEYKFRRTDSIGAAAAEDDEMLAACFVETDIERLLRNPEDRRFLVLGRTGSGKSALLSQIAATEPRSVALDPELLAFEHIGNSDIMRRLADAGVNLDPIFKFLWRHVLVVEFAKLLNTHHSYRKKTAFETFRELFTAPREREALEYLQEFGDEFFASTSERIVQVTRSLEDQVGAKLEAPGLVGLNSTSGQRVEVRQENAQILQRIVNDVQLRKLNAATGALDRALSDPQKPYFITIDKLDNDWVDDELRYRLIKCLIEVSNEFKSVSNAKIIIALRDDLFQRVIHNAKSAGFQSEKIRSSIIDLHWDHEKLEEVLDRRVSHMIRRHYTSGPIKAAEILPARVGKVSAMSYLLARTLDRPRDAIDFLNTCIKHAAGHARISETVLRSAEVEYSKFRTLALCEEWSEDAPFLPPLLPTFRFATGAVAVSAVEADTVLSWAIIIQEHIPSRMRTLHQLAHNFDNSARDADNFRNHVVTFLTSIGFLRMRLGSDSPWQTCSDIQPVMLGENSVFHVHPTFRRHILPDRRATL